MAESPSFRPHFQLGQDHLKRERSSWGGEGAPAILLLHLWPLGQDLGRDLESPLEQAGCAETGELGGNSRVLAGSWWGVCLPELGV